MPEFSLHNKIIVLTGGTGFLGSAVTELLKKEQPAELRSISSKDYDLRDQTQAAAAVRGADVVIHLAANVGGIGYNQEHPGQLFYDNLLMGTHILHESYKAGVKKFVGIGTICAYPKYTPVPFKEADLWTGYPEETNAPYGLAKKMLLVQSQAYRQEYGFNSIYLLPTNLYGPGDNFDPRSSHVIPALIQKFVSAVQSNAKEVVVWGTGAPTREFLYVTDAARAIVLATQKYSGSEPVNLGSQFEISIAELAHLIGDLTGFTGKIVFDTSKPDGQPRRKIDTSRATEEFDFTAQIPFATGIKQTLEWYKEHKNQS
jgi:GDP-L-fucose synthase